MNKQTILMSVGVFASIVVALVVVYFVRKGSLNTQTSNTPEPTSAAMSTPLPTTAPIFEIAPNSANVCSLSFSIPCTPGISCTSKMAYEDSPSNTSGNYAFVNVINSEAEVTRGQTIVYQLNYTNTGNTTIPTATFTDVLPAGLDFVDAVSSCSYTATTRTVSCTLNNVAAGASGNVAFRVRVRNDAAFGSLTNSATLTPSAGSASTCALALVLPSPSVSPSPSSSPSPSPSTESSLLDCLYKRVYEDDSRNRAGFYYTERLITDTSNLADGQTIVYSITVRNYGGASVPDVTITDVLSNNLTFVDADNGCSYDPSSRRVTCLIGSLGAGVETSRSIRVRIGVASGTASIENTADVFSTNGQRDTCSVRVDASGRVVSPSPVSVVETTTNLPTAGVFEVTASTLGVGVLFLIVGAIGLLLL